jgi:predicted transcriptional regulator
MQLTVREKDFLMLKAMSKLAIEKKDINPNSIALKANVSWHTAKKFYMSSFNIKELKQ